MWCSSMVRRRYIWDPTLNRLVEVPTSYTKPPRAHYVIPDTPDYVSPVTGLVVSGRRQRRNDLARTNSRPWEGMGQEMSEASRQRAYAEQRADKRLDESVRRTYHQMSPEKRRILEGR